MGGKYSHMVAIFSHPIPPHSFAPFSFTMILLCTFLPPWMSLLNYFALQPWFNYFETFPFPEKISFHYCITFLVSFLSTWWFLVYRFRFILLRGFSYYIWNVLTVWLLKAWKIIDWQTVWYYRTSTNIRLSTRTIEFFYPMYRQW